MSLDRRYRATTFFSRMIVIFPEKFNFLQSKLRIYVVTAELGTKIRLPGISKTIEKFEEN